MGQIWKNSRPLRFRRHCYVSLAEQTVSQYFPGFLRHDDKTTTPDRVCTIGDRNGPHRFVPDDVAAYRPCRDDAVRVDLPWDGTRRANILRTGMRSSNCASPMAATDSIGCKDGEFRTL